jgi:GT2 family glycosyltransferase
MSINVDAKVVVVIPNLSAAKELVDCLDSLLGQSLQPHIIVVDNASTDNSVELVETKYPMVELIKHDKNKGYAGGVNPGFRRAIELGAPYTAPFNNDAVADKDWLKHLVTYLDSHPEAGLAACKVLSADGKHIDSTGDWFTNWGLPYPRGRGETDIDKYDTQTEIFAASGAASLYRVAMLEQIGLLDEDFFAYYEDVDLSFRAQLAGWKVAFVPQSVVRHETSTTGNRVKGFTTYQTMKNLPLLVFKNVPRKYLWQVGWRSLLAHTLFFGRAISRGQGWAALKGDAKGTELLFKNFGERRRIQKSRTVSDEYIWGILTHDLPPNALALRRLRASWWKLTGKSHV